jgi:ferrochelatase
VGVVLFQLGGPDSIEAIEPFLANLFSDPDIIDFPLAKLARRPLARLIAARRAKHVAHHYAQIGGRSPIRELTEGQATALKAELRRDMDACVVVAMRYWRPSTADAIGELKRFAPNQIVLLPLYPQYSKTTTGSSINQWNCCFQPNGWDPRQYLVPEFHEHPGYIEAVAEAVDSSLARFDDPTKVEVVFSAHSVPLAVIESGDPYQKQIERTVELVWQKGEWTARKHLCYQSKVGPYKWLGPMMCETLEALACTGSRHVLMVPISFVSDHVETLYEIDNEHRQIALRAGIEEFRMVPGLNDSPKFISTLADLVRRRLNS